MSIATIIAVLIAYLIGSLSSAIIVCKLFHLPDPRHQGSNNPGATNVLRIGGKKVAVLTLLGDMFKGFLPVLVGHSLGFHIGVLSLMAFAAFIGHLYPVFFRFQGGKGVATALGCLLALAPWVGLLCVATWVITLMIFRYSSLSSLMFAVFAPVYIVLLLGQLEPLLMMIGMSAFLIWRHRENIKRLMAGQENKVF